MLPATVSAVAGRREGSADNSEVFASRLDPLFKPCSGRKKGRPVPAALGHTTNPAYSRSVSMHCRS